jgi:hypothetical protein
MFDRSIANVNKIIICMYSISLPTTHQLLPTTHQLPRKQLYRQLLMAGLNKLVKGQLIRPFADLQYYQVDD